MTESIKGLPIGRQSVAISTPMPVGVRKFPSEVKMEVVELRRQKVSVLEISKQLGVSRSFIYSCLKKQKGVSRRTLPRPKQLRVRPEPQPRPVVMDGPVAESAKIVFPSGIFLEIPVCSIKGEFLRVLSEVR